jgi:hypothetical protein
LTATKTQLLRAAASTLVLAALGLPAAAVAAPPYPENNSPPQVQGPEPRQEGQTLRANPGTWTPAPQSEMTFAYQWIRCSGAQCEAIPGATQQSYAVAPGEVGRRVKVRVTGNCTLPMPACQPMARDSSMTAVILPDPRNEAPPEISGEAAEGQILSASAGFWRSVAPLVFGYQWLSCDRGGGACSNVPGATGARYRLTAGDVGRTFRVGVTARNSRPREATTFSAATGQIQKAAGPAPRPRRGVRLLSPFPRIVLAGVLTRSGVALSEFSVRGPRGTLVTIRCRGRGCPFSLRRLRMRRSPSRIGALERSLPAGLTLSVTVTRRGFIGKYSRFRIRRGKIPARADRCLRPGARRPSRCPRGV